MRLTQRLTKAAVTGALILGASSALAQEAKKDFEFHGYFRSGIGGSLGGTDQVCFKPEKGSFAFRLGNECGNYGEISLLKNHGATDTGTEFKTKVTLALASDSHVDWEGADGDGPLYFALREAYVTADKAFGTTGLWVGKRFFRRRDIHMIDYYLLGHSGPGFGTENTDLGFGKLHTAITRQLNDKKDAPVQTNVELRLDDVDAGFGKFTFAYIYGATTEKDARTGEKAFEAADGHQLAAILDQELLGGSGTFALQYGMGIYGAENGESKMWRMAGAKVAKDDKTTKDAVADSSTLRLAAHLVSKFGTNISNSTVLFYQVADSGGQKVGDKEIPETTELAVGFRPAYHFSKAHSVALEYGFHEVDSVNVAAQGAEAQYEAIRMHKVTLAPQVTLGDSYWARPSIRLFATYASWNEHGKGRTGNSLYAGDDNGFSTGVQFEAWW